MIEEALGELERFVERGLRKRLSETETTELNRQAESELATYASRLSKKDMRDLVKRAELRHLFARHRLPVISLILG